LSIFIQVKLLKKDRSFNRYLELEFRIVYFKWFCLWYIKIAQFIVNTVIPCDTGLLGLLEGDNLKKSHFPIQPLFSSYNTDNYSSNKIFSNARYKRRTIANLVLIGHKVSIIWTLLFNFFLFSYFLKLFNYLKPKKLNFFHFLKFFNVLNFSFIFQLFTIFFIFLFFKLKIIE
jgi:hypothetical protein